MSDLLKEIHVSIFPDVDITGVMTLNSFGILFQVYMYAHLTANQFLITFVLILGINSIRSNNWFLVFLLLSTRAHISSGSILYFP